MDGRRGGPGGGRGGRSVSSYASLASGPPPTFEPRQDSRRDSYEDHRPRIGYSSSAGRGRGRGRYDGDRGSGRGGREPYTGVRDRRERSPSERSLLPSRRPSSLPDTSLASPVPDSSGYESGEIMPLPQRPLAHRRDSDRNFTTDRSSRDRASNYEGSGRGSSYEANGRGGPGRFLASEGRGFGGRGGRGGRGRGGRYFEGGRGRAGRSDFRDNRGGEGSVGVRSDRPTFEDTHKRNGSDSRTGGARAERPYPKGADDRSPPIGETISRSQSINEGRDSYSRLGNETRAVAPNRFQDEDLDNRIGKRARDDASRGSIEEKRPRNEDYLPTRIRPIDEERNAGSPPLREDSDRSRPQSDFRKMEQERTGDNRPGGLGGLGRGEHLAAPASINQERQGQHFSAEGYDNFNGSDRPFAVDEPRHLARPDLPRNTNLRDESNRRPPITRPESPRERIVARSDERYINSRPESQPRENAPFSSLARPTLEDGRFERPRPPPGMQMRQELRDGPRDVRRDAPRDVPRESPREIPRFTPREELWDKPKERLRGAFSDDGQRDLPRDMPRDGPRDLPRDMPRDGPRDLPRDMPRDGPRDLPRDMPRDGPRDLPRERPRDIPVVGLRDTLRDGPRDMQRDLPRDRQRDIPRDRPRDVPSDRLRDYSHDTIRNEPREFSGDGTRDGSRERLREFASAAPRDVLRDGPRDFSRDAPRDTPRDHARDFSRDAPRSLQQRDLPRGGPIDIPREVLRDNPRDFTRGGLRDTGLGESLRDLQREDGGYSREGRRDRTRDEMNDIYRSTARDLPRGSSRDGPQDPMRDGFRDYIRDGRRDVQRDDFQRDGTREFPRDFMRDATRESPRDVPAPLDTPRDISRILPREEVREFPRAAIREIQRDVPRIDPRDIPRDNPRDGPRILPTDESGDVLRVTPRELPSDGPRFIPRAGTRDRPIDSSGDPERGSFRDFRRDQGLDISREGPQNFVRDTPHNDPRNYPGDRELNVPREPLRFEPRKEPRDSISLGYTNAPGDGRWSDRNVARHDGENLDSGWSRTSSYRDRPAQPPRSDPDYPTDGKFRDPPESGTKHASTAWNSSVGSRSPSSSPVPPRRSSFHSEFRPSRDESAHSGLSDSDSRTPPPLFEGRGSFHGRGRGRGSFRGRGRGRGDYGRSSWGGRGFGDAVSNADQDSRNSSSAMQSMNNVWKPAPIPSGGLAWQAPEEVNQVTDPTPETTTAQEPPQSAPAEHIAMTTEKTPEPVKLEETTATVKDEDMFDVSKPRPISPPPPGKPSGLILALSRLVDLEAQMEYAFAKHMQLVKRQRELELQTKLLATLPVGIEAFKEELDALPSATDTST